MNSSPAVEALRMQIQRIAFDANLWDLGIADYPYAEKCSLKRKRLLAEIARLEGQTVEIPKSARKTRQRASGGQMELFSTASEASRNVKRSQKP